MTRRRTSVDRRWLMRAFLTGAVGLVIAVGCGRGKGGNDGGAFHRGRTLVCEGKYADAIVALEGYLQDQPAGKHASRAQFFIAKAQLGRLKWDAARQAFQQTIDDYPGSREAHKAEYKLAEIDFLQGDPQAALKAFDTLAKTPDGPLAPESVAWADYVRKQVAGPAEQPQDDR